MPLKFAEHGQITRHNKESKGNWKHVEENTFVIWATMPFQIKSWLLQLLMFVVSSGHYHLLSTTTHMYLLLLTTYTLKFLKGVL